jgi:MYXO-CTERM domain-containing protein
MASEVVPDVAPGTIAEAEVGDVPQADPTGKPDGGFQDAASTDGVAADSVTGAGSGGGCTAGRGDAPAALLVLAAMGFLTVRRTTRRRRHDGLQARLVAALAEAGLLARQLIQPAPRTAGRRPSGC